MTDLSPHLHFLVSIFLTFAAYALTRSKLKSFGLTAAVGLAKELTDPIFGLTDLQFDAYGILFALLCLTILERAK